MEQKLKTYKLTDTQKKRLENNFQYHPPIGDQAERYILIREAQKTFAETIMTLCPDSRELSLALTAVEDAGMYANAAIARNEKPEDFEEPK